MTVEFPLAQTTVPRLEALARTGSTNADLRAYAGDAVGWPHLSTIVTRDQTAGRGRLDRSWVAPAGSALAVSVLLRTLPVDPAVRGWVPLAAGAAMTEAVASQLPEHDVRMKWPNDVLVDGRKICGILAEATADTVVVGAGVNTAMTTEQLPVPTATSFAVLDADVDEDRLLADYLSALDRLLSRLVSTSDAGSSGLHAAVTDRCATIGQSVRVSLPAGRMLEGVATALDPEGRLVVAVDGEQQTISAGDVVHVRPAGY